MVMGCHAHVIGAGRSESPLQNSVARSVKTKVGSPWARHGALPTVRSPDTSHPTHTDRLWLALCGVSLICYLLRSEAVRAFGSEVARLVDRI